MTSRTYRLTNQALADLDEIGDFLSSRRSSAANHVLDELKSTFRSLAANPEIGAIRNDLHLGLRMFVPAKPANNYVVFFSFIPNGVLITDVIHAARNWTAMFRRGER
jgi:toxin ParE1/3/4